MSATVLRLESNYVYIFANCSHYCILRQAIFGEASTMKGENFAEHIFVNYPKEKKKKLF